ncbi:MAG: NAD(P)/FAD-dependent oxidoreductase [Promethearchaeota archaeon]|nr:MAG: NAD(P)/FAD-dependent oxidoreductase [Candidatus Lokiarchaeota archaeon]
MRVVIIGNGVAGQTAADRLRKADPNLEIEIFTQEPYPYYSRIFLPHYIAGERPLGKMLLRNQQWYKDNSIQLHLNTPIVRIDPLQKLVWVQHQESGSQSSISYEKLILATGSNARKLPFGHPDIDGMFTLRTIANADIIKSYITDKRVKQVLILGGGLLGIELGYHLRDLVTKVTICELAPYLLPRQLDEGTSHLLQKYLEKQGLNIICGQAAQEVLGESHVQGIRFQSGEVLDCDMILQQMGIIPAINLAKQANLETEKGIKANEFLQTSNPDIYAAGDGVQFKNLIWGIIPASMEQATIATEHILGRNPEPYAGSFWNTRLKIAGINLSCLGAPPSEGMEEELLIENVDMENYICKKVRLDKSTLKSAILMGPGSDQFFLKHLGKDVNVDEVKRALDM